MSWELVRAGEAAGRGLRALVDVSPTHPANAVKAVYSHGGGPDREVRGHCVSRDLAAGTQTFAIDLPSPPPGLNMLWRPVLMRSGRVLDPVRGGQPPDPVGVLPSSPLRPPDPAREAPAMPHRFPFEPVFLFRVTARFRPDMTPTGVTPDGIHLYYELVEGGTVRGPALDAVLLPRNGDRVQMRPDGIGVADIEATMVTPKGGIVLLRYSGLIDTGPDGFAAMLAGTGPKHGSVRFTPRYATSVPELMWMNRVQGFGIGVADLERQTVEYDVYAFGPADLPI
jgi:hypothetical protein